jgi:FtsZ-binding cell division protein ZapB
MLIDTLEGRQHVSEVERARAVLERERAEVVAALEQAGAEARDLAARQAAWREQVMALLDRANAAGVAVTDMAKALGLSRQWTSHLLARRVKAAEYRVMQEIHESFEFVPRGRRRVQQRRQRKEEPGA